MESVVRDAVNKKNHVTAHDLFADSHNGFTPSKSCTSQLLCIFEELTQLIDHGDPVDIMCLDFRKAFDAVPHRRLLKQSVSV